MKKWVRTAVLLSAYLILLAGIIGVYTWGMHRLEIENILQSRTVDVVINEEFDDLIVEADATVTKQVSFENTGSDAVLLRFTYADYWQTDTELLEGYSDSVTKNWTVDLDDWYYEDGWYYYRAVLAAGESVDILDSVTFGDDLPDDATYNLFFQVETVQVSDEASINTAVSEELFGVTATVEVTKTVDGAVTAGNVTWGEVTDDEAN